LKQKRWDLWNQRKTKTRKLSSFYGVEMRVLVGIKIQETGFGFAL